MATADLLSRNLPRHADELGSFGGGDRERPWGTGKLVEAVGGRDDIILNAKLPDDSNQLRIRNPDISWDGPANDDPEGVIQLLEAPSKCYSYCSDYDTEADFMLGEHSRIMFATDGDDASLLLQEGCTPVRCAHIDCIATPHGTLLAQSHRRKAKKDKTTSPTTLGDVHPLDAQVNSAPNLLEPDELCIAKAKIVYKPGSFARKCWDRWHGKASAEDMRATEVHMPRYRVRDGFLQKKVLGMLIISTPW